MRWYQFNFFHVVLEAHPSHQTKHTQYCKGWHLAHMLSNFLLCRKHQLNNMSNSLGSCCVDNMEGEQQTETPTKPELYYRNSFPRYRKQIYYKMPLKTSNPVCKLSSHTQIDAQPFREHHHLVKPRHTYPSVTISCTHSSSNTAALFLFIIATL